MASEWKLRELHNFTKEELIFDEEETREILQFFFPADHKQYHEQIDSMPITDDLRNLAQGMLVAAVDASYAMGWIEATFRAVANPRAGLQKTLLKFARRAARHWFTHLKKNQSLKDAKIYESVRSTLEGSCRGYFLGMVLAEVQGARPLLAHCTINCSTPTFYYRLVG
jgi:hypothetical protein